MRDIKKQCGLRGKGSYKKWVGEEWGKDAANAKVIASV